MKPLEIITEQAYFNKWLLELTLDEIDHICNMMEVYANDRLVKQREKIENLLNELKTDNPISSIAIAENELIEEIRAQINEFLKEKTK